MFLLFFVLLCQRRMGEDGSGCLSKAENIQVSVTSLSAQPLTISTQDLQDLLSILIFAGGSDPPRCGARGNLPLLQWQPRYLHHLTRLLQLSQHIPVCRYRFDCLLDSPTYPVFPEWSHFSISHFPGWTVQPINFKATFKWCKANFSSHFQLPDISSMRWLSWEIIHHLTFVLA